MLLYGYQKTAIADQLQQNSRVIESNYSEMLDYTSHVMVM